jgi:hypothetical protein
MAAVDFNAITGKAEVNSLGNCSQAYALTGQENVGEENKERKRSALFSSPTFSCLMGALHTFCREW